MAIDYSNYSVTGSNYDLTSQAEVAKATGGATSGMSSKSASMWGGIGQAVIGAMHSYAMGSIQANLQKNMNRINKERQAIANERMIVRSDLAIWKANEDAEEVRKNAVRSHLAAELEGSKAIASLRASQGMRTGGGSADRIAMQLENDVGREVAAIDNKADLIRKESVLSIGNAQLAATADLNNTQPAPVQEISRSLSLLSATSDVLRIGSNSIHGG